MTTRVMPPAVGGNPITVNGRTYNCAVGSTIDVPDWDAQLLSANGWLISAAGGVGATAARPANPKRGDEFVDTALGAQVIYDGKQWRNKTSGATA
jgi:hypothetical protein